MTFRNKANTILCVAVLICVGILSTFGQNNKLFGLELGAEFTVPECSLSLKENKALLGRKYWTLEYATSAPGDTTCYKRVLPKNEMLTKKSALPTLPLPRVTEGFVAIQVADNLRPEFIANGEDGVIGNLFEGKLNGILFSFHKSSADDVRDALVARFGKKYTTTPMKAQNSYGAVLDYYVATWEFPLKVPYSARMQSAGMQFSLNLVTPDKNMDNNPFAPSKVDGLDPMLSPYGQVTVLPKGPDKKDSKKIGL